jgi:hypothetical protein
MMMQPAGGFPGGLHLRCQLCCQLARQDAAYGGARVQVARAHLVFSPFFLHLAAPQTGYRICEAFCSRSCGFSRLSRTSPLAPFPRPAPKEPTQVGFSQL